MAAGNRASNCKDKKAAAKAIKEAKADSSTQHENHDVFFDDEEPAPDAQLIRRRERAAALAKRGAQVRFADELRAIASEAPGAAAARMRSKALGKGHG
mgnify:CR=1 FL=1